MHTAVVWTPVDIRREYAAWGVSGCASVNRATPVRPSLAFGLPHLTPSRRLQPMSSGFVRPLEPGRSCSTAFLSSSFVVDGTQQGSNMIGRHSAHSGAHAHGPWQWVLRSASPRILRQQLCHRANSAGPPVALSDHRERRDTGDSSSAIPETLDAGLLPVSPSCSMA